MFVCVSVPLAAKKSRGVRHSREMCETVFFSPHVKVVVYTDISNADIC